MDILFTPARGFCTIVGNKTAAYMLPVIARVVRPGSEILTDKFKSYLGPSNISDYIHETACYKYIFDNSTTEMHIQNVKFLMIKLN